MKEFLKNKAAITATILTILLLLRDLAGVSISQYIILGIILIACVLASFNELMILCAFIAPILAGVNAFSALLLLLAMVVKCNHIRSQQIIPVVILMLIEFAHNTVFKFPIMNELLYACMLGTFFFTINVEEDVDYSKVVKYFVIGCSLAIFLVVGRTYAITGSLAGLFLDNARATVSMGRDEMTNLAETHMALNADSLAFLSATSIGCLMLGKRLLKMSSYIYWPALVIAISGGFVSLARTWVLVVALITIIYVATSNAKRKLSFVLLMIGAFLVVLQTDALSSIFDMIAGSFMDRFTSADLSEAGGRSSIWDQYMSVWTSSAEYIFIGSGAPNYRELFPQFNAMHNVIQQVFFCTGILGLCVYIVVISKYLMNCVRERKPIMYFLPFAAGFVFLQSISLLANFLLLPCLFPCLLALKIDHTETLL